MEYSHQSVLLDEIVSFMPNQAKVAVDLTIGGAGQAYFLLEKNPQLFLYGIDRDEEALKAARIRLEQFSDRIRLQRDAYSSAIEKLIEKEVKADYIIADLGVSSYQLNNLERGFSFRSQGPLDMRMNQEDKISATEIVNNYNREQLTFIFQKYGEEKFSAKIADRIVKTRENKKLVSTEELTACVLEAIPKKFQFGKIHPATKIFQAIRIAVNEEIEELKKMLARVLDLLKPGGHLAVIAFHSLEDRLVKNAFSLWQNPCQCPTNIPRCICHQKPVIRILNKKIIRPSALEIENNNRARSARLRVMEKI